MFPRVVSAVLILALIGCPMWCGNGMCQADSGCSLQQPSPSLCAVHGSAECCCATAGEGDENAPPCGCPGKSCPGKSCQGICGGAIFEKPAQLDDDPSSWFGVITDCRVSQTHTPTSGPLFLRQVERGDAEPYGRFLRTLYASFLF